MKHYDKLYIAGEWVASVSPTTREVVNPSTEEPFATVTLGCSEDVDRAVEAAQRAFPVFSKTTKKDRIALLERIVTAYKEREAELQEIVKLELGAPRSQTGHVQGPIRVFEHAIATLKDYKFETRVGDEIIRREPIGVCGLIAAWNWPVQMLAIKVAYAFAAGCPVVLKPSEFTSVTAIVFSEILHAAKVPKGVFNLVTGDGPEVGNAISKHPGIAMVSFTGSTRAGILVAEAAAPTVKRVCQELGGKSANIVLPDADLKAAARWNVARGFFNSGQSCHAPTRILVQEQQLDEFLRLCESELENVKLGNPDDASTTVGPVVNKAQFERVQGYIKKGIDEGARVVFGGLGRPDGLERGYFVKPTLFAGVRPDMTIAQEEIFGPVLSVITYKTESEAVEIANGTDYGLGAYVFASTAKRGYEIGSQMSAGRVFLNGAPDNLVAPMGGYKKSGNGREMGVYGLEEHLEVKAMFGFATQAEE
jgi:aldehyde dehydrogenase (NAD+)